MRDIKGYEGLYAITSCGKVWSYRSQKFLKPADNGHGYLSLVLTKDGIKKHYRVHRLVAEAYLGEPEGRDVNHKDSCRSNNNVNNLEYVSRQENCRLANICGNKNRVRIICVETGEIYNSQAEAARETGIGRYNISNCITGKQKTAGGYHWECVE